MILGDPSPLLVTCLVEQTFDMVLLVGHQQRPRWRRALSRLGLTIETLPSRVMRVTTVPVCVVR